MSGTKAGGIKTRKTIYENHGKDFYRKIGAIGGRKSKRGKAKCNYAIKKQGKYSMRLFEKKAVAVLIRSSYAI